MIAININVSGLNAALNKIRALPVQVARVMERTTYLAGTMIKDTAVNYAPVSPTTTLLKGISTANMLARGWSKKRIRNVRLAGKARRKPNASSRPMPGALQDSITMRNTPDRIDIFVPENSPAGKYAVKIHDERGVTWWNRGPGTIAKGAQAKEKFIERAIQDNIPQINQIVRDQIDRVLRG